VRILIVYDEPALQSALGLQLQARGYAAFCVTAAELSSGAAQCFIDIDTEEDCVLIDCASRETAQATAPALADESFRQLVELCARRRWHFLLLSDSRVFPGGSKQRYREADSVQPVSAVGNLLAQREQYLMAQASRHIILRSGPLIASSGANLLTDLLARLRAGGSVAVANAPRFCPTPAADLARVISAICDQLDCAARRWGIYHYHSSDAASGYEFAEVLLAAAAQYWDVGGGHVQLQVASDAPFGALFPTLNCQHIRDTYGIQQLPWRKAIPQLLKTIYAGQSS
jgi:dTDP-4-dehydrorhamnose reductase